VGPAAESRWDVTDFGLGHFDRCGLVLVNLAEQPEYCEKLMYADKDQVTPQHYHMAKKEDIICRYGRLALRLVAPAKKKTWRLQINGAWTDVPTNRTVVLQAGERITLTRKVPHLFWADTPYAIIGEVSTANDDVNDNFFKDKRIGRFSEIVEDEKPLVRLVSDP